MTRWKHDYWKVIGGNAVAAGMQGVVTAAASAHGGSHGKETKATAATTADEHHTPAPETAASESPESSNTEGMVMPAADMPMPADETPIEETPAAQESPAASVSQANAAEGFSMGLGESLLGLIIAGPFLLLSLKKQLQS